MKSKESRSQAWKDESSSEGFGGFGNSSQLAYTFKPPDLSSILDPNVVVSFKSLLRNSSTTKEKALEDLLQQFGSRDGTESAVEEAELDAWVSIYPRLSIDSSYGVQRLAHKLQGKIASLCGKRTARHMPTIVGAWLAGIFDVDRSVASAASVSLAEVFSTEQKRGALWTIYQNAIIEYASGIVLHESAETLSDLRSIKPDEAESKYNRALTSALRLFAVYVRKCSSTELAPEASTLLKEPKLWRLASSPDAIIRCTLYRLLHICLTELPGLREDLDPKMLRKAFLSEALLTDQMRSTLPFTNALLALTECLPVVWPVGKSKERKYLFRFLEKGSRAGFPVFWTNMEKILCKMPKEVFVDAEPEKKTIDTVMKLLKAFRTGIGAKDEPKDNILGAWEAYIRIANDLSSLLDKMDKSALFEDCLLPLLEQFVLLRPRLREWTMDTPWSPKLCAQACQAILNIGDVPMLTKCLERLCSRIIKDTRAESSLDEIEETASAVGDLFVSIDRLFYFQVVLAKLESESIRAFVTEKTQQLSIDAIELLKKFPDSDNAATILHFAIQEFPSTVLDVESTKTDISKFFTEDNSKYFASASSTSTVLINVLLACQSQGGFDVCLESTVAKLMEDNSPISQRNLQKILSSVDFNNFTRTGSAIEDFLMQCIESGHTTNIEHFQNVSAYFKNATGSNKVKDGLLRKIFAKLSDYESVSYILQGLKQSSAEILENFAESDLCPALLTKLIFLRLSPDGETSETAQKLEIDLRVSLPEDQEIKMELESKINVIKNGLSSWKHFLPIDALTELAQETVLHINTPELKGKLNQLFPSEDLWKAALEPYRYIRPSPSLAITNPFGRATLLVEVEQEDGDQRKSGLPAYDLDGFGPLFRLAKYTRTLVYLYPIHENIPEEVRRTVFLYLPIVSQIASDSISVPGKNLLWNFKSPIAEKKVDEFVSESQQLITSWLKPESRFYTTEKIYDFWDAQLNTVDSLSPLDFYVAQAAVAMCSQFSEQASTLLKDKLTETAGRILSMRKSANVLRDLAWLNVYQNIGGDQNLKSKLCNELVADLTGLNFAEFPQVAVVNLMKLATFPDAFDNEDDRNNGSIISILPHTRLVFFVKHLARELKGEPQSKVLIYMILYSFRRTLPGIKDLYDSLWNDILVSIHDIWNQIAIVRDEDISVMHASLNLLSVMHEWNCLGTNEDIVDAWNKHLPTITKDLLHLLTSSRDSLKKKHQPLEIYHEVLTRLIKKMDISFTETSELYPLVYSESTAIQDFAYESLHRQIPKAQEEISVEVALSKSAARLPDELLSLITETPTVSYSDFCTAEPTDLIPLKGYLLSWKLVFDHFVNSSYKVRTDYSDSIKEGQFLNSLLDQIVHLLNLDDKGLDLGHQSASIVEYHADDLGQTDIRALLCHLYYLSLKHFSSFTRSWFFDLRTGVKSSVEDWTSKWICPLLISDALDSVKDWVTTMPQDNEHPMEVRIQNKSRRVTASFEIDDQTMMIAIELPSTYPLGNATVEGISRVATNEKKWRSWLLTTQAVIMVSNGGIVDGLVAFRKNVLGTLSNQQECSICFCIVSEEKRLPSKRCSTCKNLFHSDCLFKWFKNSAQSSCPLCRTPFNLTNVDRRARDDRV